MRTVLVELVIGVGATLAGVAWVSRVQRRATRAVVVARLSDPHRPRLARRKAGAENLGGSWPDTDYLSGGYQDLLQAAQVPRLSVH